MKILFLHFGFPGQFRALAPALAARGHEVRALTNARMQEPPPGVTVTPYALNRSATPGIHPWLETLEHHVARGEACFEAARRLAAEGYRPDVVIAHPGWGESLFLKDVWPEAKLALYCEHYHHVKGTDLDFDPEFPLALPAQPCLTRLDNSVYDMQFDTADAGISPTAWQAGLFPAGFRPRIEVIHDGVDTDLFAPQDVRLQLADGLTLSREDEVVTFVNRQFEPVRGCHIFLRALPEILARRPSARVVLVGDESGYGYGRKPSDAPSWLHRFVEEVRPRVTDDQWARVHFLGKAPYALYRGLLQLSSVHVYLTYPFVLSWSLIEAMSTGCAIVASDTAPVREAIRHDETGRLVDFFDVKGLAEAVVGLLADPEARRRLGRAARAEALARYDLKTVCLPSQIAWLDRLAGAAP